ncbi:MAG: hypothetical protein ACLF0G_04970 [Candidatus Brocadiia bacterium]
MKRWWFACVYALFFVALNWPVLALANRIEPWVAGTPFLIAWYLFWSFGLAVFHAVFLLTRRRDPSLDEPPEGEDGG